MFDALFDAHIGTYFDVHEGRLDRLNELLAEVRQGAGRVAVVGGPVGGGKSALLRAFAERAAGPAGGEQPPLVLTAAGDPGERSVAFGVLRQLLHGDGAGFPDGVHELRRLLAGAGGGEPPPQVLHDVALALLGMVTSAEQPLVVVLDDARLVDGPSWHCLTSLLRRARRPRTLLVVAESGRGARTDVLARALLPVEPQCRTVDVPLLRADDVARLLDGPGHASAALARTADEVVALTGGHPLLVEGLLVEVREAVRRTGGPADVSRALDGEGFRRALAALLLRCEDTTAEVLRALAVLGPGVRTERVAELAGLDEASCARRLRAAEATGLLHEGGFRHPAVPGLLLGAMPPEERRRLHSRAAHVLFADGAPSREAARHLVQAGCADAPWALPLLHEAAEHATAEGEAREALGYVRLAGHSGGDERQRAAASALRVRAEWQADPVQAMRHLPTAVRASREGHLSAADTLSLVPPLLWFGRVEDAFDAVQRIGGKQDALTYTERSRLHAARLWLSALYPAAMRGQEGQENVLAGPAGADPQVEAALLLALVVSPGSSAEADVEAERALRRGTLDERTVMLCVSALISLIHQGRLDVARTSCDRLVAEAARRSIPMWHGLLAALRAEIALYGGELEDAVRFARTALDVLPAEAWGVRIAVPLGILVQAHVARGAYEEADALVGAEVPDALFQSPIAFYHLQARGRYLLAVGGHRAALEEFRLMGELATQWGVALPGHLSWRLDLARAQLRAGQPVKCRELVYAELDRAGADNARVRGECLRLLAAAADGESRAELYRQACDTLRGAGARLELAHALAGLADAQRAAGLAAAADRTWEESLALARACGVRDTERVLTVDRAPAEAEPAGAGGEPSAGLTEAEHRVAALAAAGFSNRRISGRLFITVSTVEQHLTRIYRKLGVTRRGELAAVYPLPEGGAR